MFTTAFALLISCFNQGVSNEKAVADILKASLGNDVRNKAMVSEVLFGEGKGAPTLVLYGTVSDSQVQFPEVEKNAKTALENAGKWNFSGVDASRLIRKPEAQVDQILNYLQADTKPFADADQFAISQVSFVKGKKLEVIGRVSSESARARCAKECDERLKAAIRRKDLELGSFEIDTASMNRSPSKYYDTIVSSLENSPEAKARLKDLKLVYADVVPGKGKKDTKAARIVGVSPDDSVTLEAKKLVEAALKNAYPDISEVDASAVFMGDLAANQSRIIQSLVPTLGESYLVTQKIQGGTVSLVGRMPDEESAFRYLDIVSRVLFVNRVEDQNVIIGTLDKSSLKNLEMDPGRALRRRDPQMLLQTSAPLIVTASPFNQTALEGWYYRAVAHVMLGEYELAAGDLKAARMLEKKYLYNFSYLLLEDFQGPQREKFEEIYRYGAAN